MKTLLWPLALVVAFFIGYAVAGVARKAPSEETVGRLQQQVSTLQARLRSHENLAATRQSWATVNADRPVASQAARTTPPPGRIGAAAAMAERSFAESPALPGAGQPRSASAPERASSRSAAPATVAPGPTLEAALERFSRYVEATTGPEGRGRWQQAREIVDELRSMGDVGAQALMQVLAGGNDSDERRAAARLLGTLQVPQALPLLRDIIDKEDDVLLRRAAASGLRLLQTPESLPVMERMLMNPDEDRFVRLSAAHGLAESGKPVGLTGLTQIFEESAADGRGRELAFRALRSLNDERPLPFMRHVVASESSRRYGCRRSGI